MFNPSDNDEVDSSRCLRKEIAQIYRNNARRQLPTYNDNEMNVDVGISARPCTKRRKSVSTVWDDFLRDKGEDGRERTVCKHCKMVVNSNNSSTTNLKKHLETCRNRRNEDGTGDTLSETGPTSAAVKANCVMDQEMKHFDVARMIIKNGILSLNSIKAEILHVYREEKEKLRGFFSKLPCRLSLTVDRLQRYSDDNFCYCLTVHFIDDNWELKRKIISVKCIENGCDVETLQSVLLDWKIHRSIIAADVVHEFEEIRGWLQSEGSLRFGGNLISIANLVFSLEDIVSGGEKLAVDIIQKIRKSFDYVHETSNLKNFTAATECAVSKGMKVPCGIPSTSASVMEMLETAVGLKEAFLCLARTDPVFKSMTLKCKEWNKASALSECFQVLKDASCILWGKETLTANMFFPKLCEIHRKLDQLDEKSRWFVTEEALLMRCDVLADVDESCNSVLAIAAVLDPRFKKDVVKRWCRKLDETDGDIFYRTINCQIVRAVRQYEKGYPSDLNSTASTIPGIFSASFDLRDSLGSPCTPSDADLPPCDMLDNLGRPCESSDFDEYEFRRYLNEPKHPSLEDFDILGWWRFNARRLPILARMARDFLSISFATPHNCFFADVHNLVNSKDLDSDIMEAFVCTKNWLGTP